MEDSYNLEMQALADSMDADFKVTKPWSKNENQIFKYKIPYGFFAYAVTLRLKYKPRTIDSIYQQYTTKLIQRFCNAKIPVEWYYYITYELGKQNMLHAHILVVSSIKLQKRRFSVNSRLFNTHYSELVTHDDLKRWVHYMYKTYKYGHWSELPNGEFDEILELRDESAHRCMFIDQPDDQLIGYSRKV